MKLLAPNGQPSNLTSEQYRLVRTPAFKEWFGDWENNPSEASKVVDSNGEPLVVFRGMSEQSSKKYVFNYNYYQIKESGRRNKFGFYFTDNYDVARGYAIDSSRKKIIEKIKNIYNVYENSNDFEADASKNAIVKEYFVKINNYLDLRSYDSLSYIDLLKILNVSDKDISDFIEKYFWKKSGRFIQKHEEKFAHSKRVVYDLFITQIEKGVDIEDSIGVYFKNKITEKYNGVVFTENTHKKSDTYVAFESNQIKLADGSNTTFDSNNPDIRFDNGGTTMKAPKLLAPNGKPSNLTPEQYKLVRTPKFKDWFGDWENEPENASKVVDSNGEPLVVRHFSQSKKRHTIFKEKAKKNEWSVSQTGIYFTSLNAKELNDAYNRTGKGILYEVFLNIKNLLDLGIYDTYDFVSGKPVFWKKHHFEMLDKYVTKGRVGTFEDYTEFEKKTDYTSIQDISQNSKDKILKLGYNGIWGNKPNGIYYVIDELVVFYPNQIKLADGSNTTFDGNNPDIRYDLGGEVIPKGKEGDCYKNVQDYLLDNDLPNAFIVHGEVTNGLGKTIGHAWIVNGVNVIDPTTGVITTKENYYERLNPKEEARYNFMDAIKMRFKTQNYGAWTDAEVEKILGNGKKFGGGEVPEGAKLLPLTMGKFAIVDAEDFDWLSEYKWRLGIHKAHGGNKEAVNYYGQRTIYTGVKNASGGRGQMVITLGKQILGIPESKELRANYIDGDNLNCQKSNLRIASVTQINYKKSKFSGETTSKYKGVSKKIDVRRSHIWWLASIKPTKDGKPLEKTFPFTPEGEILAGKQYDEWAKKYQGDFAVLNFLDDKYAKGGGVGYVSYRDKYNKKYGYEKNESHSLKEISKDTGVSNKGLQKIYNKGIGAFKTNPSSVRPNVKSKEQWAKARVYSAVMGGKAARVDAKELKMNNGGEILLAPNGKPSNLTSEQYRLVRTPAFKAWFGDWERLANATIKDPAIDVITLGNISKDVSKVVDENGEPLVVYHGSKSNRFNSFNIISETHRGVEVGSHFGTYIQSQKIIAQRKSKNLAFQLYEVFLCIKNIIRVDDINWWTPANINKFIFQKNKIKISSNNPSAKDVIEQLNKEKINGFIYSNLHEGEGHSYVVFNPNQIKLADGTNTTFDGSNPDIRYSGGGVVDADIPTYLYHTTPSNNFQKIKQNGLSVAFDNRIYFTKNLSSSIDIANQLHKAYKENENVEFYHIWKIDTNKLTNPIFFKDEDYDNAVYITEPIPKNAIKYYESTKIKYADGGGYIGSCVDIGSSNKEVCEYFPNATIMAEYVGNPDENEWGKSKETTPKEFYKYVSKDDVPKKAINGEHTYHYIAQDGSNRDMNINETAIYFIYNIASDIHYFFKKTKHKTGGDLVNEPYISDNFQIGPNGAYEHTEESEIINQYADGVDLKKKLKKPKKPKGDCYYAAAQLVMGNRFKHLFGDNNITYIGTPYLVHAEVRGQGKVANIRFGHAWVEDDENIYDYSNGNQFVMPKEIYYAIGDIDNQNPLKYQKYTFEEARRKMVTTRHYGEWDLEVDC